MSSISSKPYKFTIVNGVITNVYEYKNGRFKVDSIDGDETYTFDGTNVIKTEIDDGRLETTVFSDVDADGVYYQIGRTGTPSTGGGSVNTNGTSSQNGYQFTVVNGVVTAVSEIERGISHQERIDSNEQWSVDGVNFVKTEVEHGVTETTVYTDADGNGIYTKTSKTYTANDGTVWSGRTGEDSDDRWNGSGSDDSYHAGLGNDQVAGGVGNDDLYGGDGNDRLNGDSGSDDLYGGDGDDNLLGGDGDDHEEGDIGNDSLDGGAGNDNISGGEGTDNLLGGLGDDDLYGDSGADRLSGGDGSDDLYGGLDNDSLAGNNGIDHLEGNEGNDSLDGGSSDDYLDGGLGTDNLLGGAGNDDLYGGDGADIMFGGIGSDDLYGGLGNDSFSYSSVLESGLTSTSIDHIYDFRSGDKINLSSIDAKYGFTRNDAFTFVGSGSAVTSANANGALWVVGDVVYGSNDRDTAAEFSIQVVGVTNLTAADFVL